MKMTDGLFPQCSTRSPRSIPISKMSTGSSTSRRKTCDTPETFDVIVMPNLYGDVLSDVAQIAAQSASRVGKHRRARGDV